MTKNTVLLQGEFDWSKQLRGIMLSAFFWGYIITQVPTGWLTSRWGSKLVITVATLVANVANILIPVAARTHPYIVVALRFTTGLGHVRHTGVHTVRKCIHVQAPRVQADTNIHNLLQLSVEH